MNIVGVAVFTLSVGMWIFCYYSLNTIQTNRPGIASRFGVLLYLAPISLGIIGILSARWYALIGIPLGWIIFTPIIFSWFYGLGSTDSLNLDRLKTDLEKTQRLIEDLERGLSFPFSADPTHRHIITETRRNLKHYKWTEEALKGMIRKKEGELKRFQRKSLKRNK